MGRLFMWFQKDSVAELEKDRAKIVEEIQDKQEELKAIDEKIAEIKSKNNSKH